MPETKCGFNDCATGTGRDLLVLHGPTLVVEIGFDPSYLPAPHARPNLSGTHHNALVDTGATESCIDSGLAMQLNLPIVDRRRISGVGGVHDVNMHIAQIHIPTLSYTIYGMFAGVDLIAGGQPHYALIGRTFLKAFRMIYDGNTGTVILATT